MCLPPFRNPAHFFGELEGGGEVFGGFAVGGAIGEGLAAHFGMLGEFLGREFGRDSFVAFMASSKRGKSFWLADLDYRAVRQGCRVVHFEAGDLSQRQVMRRFGMRVLRRPRLDKTVQVPVEWEHNDKELKWRSRELAGVTPQEAFKAWEKNRRVSNNLAFKYWSNKIGFYDELLQKVAEGE